MPGYWDPVERTFVYRKDFQCIGCKKAFPSYSIFLDHGNYRKVPWSWEVIWECGNGQEQKLGDTSAGNWSIEDGKPVPAQSEEDKRVEDSNGNDADAGLEEIIGIDRSMKQLNDSQSYPKSVGFMSISRDKDPIVENGGTSSDTFELYSSSQPRFSFVGSGGYRNSPISTLAWENRNHTSIASPRSFNTAQSSLASYATASSVPHPKWQLSGLRHVTTIESSESLSEGTVDEIGWTVENMDAFLKSNGNFEPLVDWVTTQVQNAFRTSKIRQETLRMIVKSCLWDLDSGEPFSVGFKHQDNSKEAYKKLGDSSLGPDFLSLEQDRDVALKTNIEQHLGPLDRLFYMLARCKNRLGMRIYRFEELEDPERLRRQLVNTIKEYLDGQPIVSDTTQEPVFSSHWLEHLYKRGILLGRRDELNWSGRGQHVEYKAEEESDIPLQLKKVLGHSASAIVESVQCRRILLARKTVKCNRHLTKENVVVEVEHLQRLQHWHIIRVVGTYTLRKNLSILLYPSADQNLEEFMDDVMELTPENPRHALHVMPMFFGCLSNAISFIHSNNVKHMDIKPKNILVRQINDYFKVYVADFGIARAYKSAAESFTDSPTSFTRTYAAPEVMMQDTRGYPADIFSLGCVFMEMFASMISAPTSDKRDDLARTRGTDYQAHIGEVVDWYLDHCRAAWLAQYMRSIDADYIHEVIALMLNRSPEKRPSAHILKGVTAELCCSKCDHGPEPFEAVDTKDT
jgi:tRNA A-37 threonylcarbamoyl transferase component Bud32